MIQTEVNNLLTGNAEQIRAFLGKLDVFTAELNKQRDDIARAIESTNKLFVYVARRNNTLDRLLVDLPPLVELSGRRAGPGQRRRRLRWAGSARSPARRCRRRRRICGPTSTCCSVR